VQRARAVLADVASGGTGSPPLVPTTVIYGAETAAPAPGTAAGINTVRPRQGSLLGRDRSTSTEVKPPRPDASRQAPPGLSMSMAVGPGAPSPRTGPAPAPAPAKKSFFARLTRKQDDNSVEAARRRAAAAADPASAAQAMSSLSLLLPAAAAGTPGGSGGGDSGSESDGVSDGEDDPSETAAMAAEDAEYAAAVAASASAAAAAATEVQTYRGGFFSSPHALTCALHPVHLLSSARRDRTQAAVAAYAEAVLAPAALSHGHHRRGPPRKHTTFRAAFALATRGRELIEKVRSYREMYTEAKTKLETIQNSVGRANAKAAKLHALLRWHTPQVTNKLCTVLAVVALVLWFVPFRLIFPFVVLYVFTLRFQSESSALDRMLDDIDLGEEPNAFVLPDPAELVRKS